MTAAYQSSYTLAEFWAELTKGTLWAAFAKANPVEAKYLNDTAAAKIAQKPWTLPNGVFHTHTGLALAMVVLTLP